jgi:hypothetical protein
MEHCEFCNTLRYAIRKRIEAERRRDYATYGPQGIEGLVREEMNKTAYKLLAMLNAAAADEED